MTPDDAATGLELRLARLNIAAKVEPSQYFPGGEIVLTVTVHRTRLRLSTADVMSDWCGYPVRVRAEA